VNFHPPFTVPDFEEAIKISEEALENLSEFNYDNDIWFKRRIAVSNDELGNSELAIELIKRHFTNKKRVVYSKGTCRYLL
jgi:hypothetical protein